MILGLRSAIYPVNDLAAAKRWYALVLETEPYFDEPFYVGFNVGGFELGLLPGGQPGVVGVAAYWGVADAAKSFSRLVELVQPAWSLCRTWAPESRSAPSPIRSATVSRSSRIRTFDPTP